MKIFSLIVLVALALAVVHVSAYPTYEDEMYADDYYNGEEFRDAKPVELWTGSSDISDVTIPHKPNSASKRPIGSGFSKAVTVAPVVTKEAPAATPSPNKKSSTSQVNPKESNVHTRGPGGEAGQTLGQTVGQTGGNSGAVRPGAPRPVGNRPGNGNNRPGNSGGNRPGNNNRPGSSNRNKNKEKNKNSESEESDEDSNSQESAEETDADVGSDETVEEEEN